MLRRLLIGGSGKRGISSAGRAPDLHSGGQRFDPAILHHLCRVFRGVFMRMVAFKILGKLLGGGNVRLSAFFAVIICVIEI